MMENRMRKQYKVSTHYGHYIDKTDRLQKGIEVFPSIYIEGMLHPCVSFLLTGDRSIPFYLY